MRPEFEEITDAAALRARLRRVYWLGGGSGAGKSTIARRIAAEHGIHVYATDDVMADHASRSTPEDAPYLRRFKTMDMDERWVNRSPETMLKTFHWFRGEGFRLLPHLVKPLLSEASQAVWLLPTPEFRKAAFDIRGTAWDIPGKTSDPELALPNLLKRDRLFTERLVEETKRLELTVIEINTAMTEDELTRQVTQAYGL